MAALYFINSICAVLPSCEPFCNSLASPLGAKAQPPWDRLPAAGSRWLLSSKPGASRHRPPGGAQANMGSHRPRLPGAPQQTGLGEGGGCGARCMGWDLASAEGLGAGISAAIPAPHPWSSGRKCPQEGQLPSGPSSVASGRAAFRSSSSEACRVLAWPWLVSVLVLRRLYGGHSALRWPPRLHSHFSGRLAPRAPRPLLARPRWLCRLAWHPIPLPQGSNVPAKAQACGGGWSPGSS